MPDFKFTYQGKVYPIDYRVETLTDGKHAIQKYIASFRGKRIQTGNIRDLITKLEKLIDENERNV